MKKGEVKKLRDNIEELESDVIAMDIRLQCKEQTISILYNLLLNRPYDAKLGEND